MNNRKNTFLTFLFFSCLSVFALNSQTNSGYRAIGDAKVANDFFNSQNYRLAMEEYKLLFKEDSTNIITNHYFAICYLNTNIDKKNAIPLLEYVTKHKDCNPQAWYDLGRAYRYVYRLDEAIKAFKKFESLSSGEENNYISASRQIEMCENAIVLIKNPIDVSFNNMGPLINSPYPDFNAYVTASEKALYFSSKRNGNLGSLIDFDGYRTTDIYYSEYKYYKWNKARRLSPLINTSYIEESTGISADGDLLYIFVVNQTAVNDVLFSQKKGRSFQRSVSPGPNINDVGSSEYAASISPDKNLLFFSSDRSGGSGGKDIYISKKLPSGEWGPAKNAGNIINTEYDEDFPYLTPDGKSFYFCSLGHNSMGGYDIFRSEWNADNFLWSEPENIGYPLNTASDNMCISFSQSGRHAYVSMFLDDGIGDLDIYRVTFNNIEPVYTVINCVIMESDSSRISDPENFLVKVTENKSGRDIGQYLPNKESGSYTIILPPGEFKLEVKAPGFQAYQEEISIPDRGFFIRKININIILKN